MYKLSVLLTSLLSTAALAQLSDDVNMSSLSDMNLEQLLNISVSTASRSEESWADAPGIVSVISAADIERFGATNLGEIVERVASTYWVGSYVYPQNVMSIRGDFSTHFDNTILLLINGRPIRDGFSGGYHSTVYLGFPVQAVRQVEVIRGPGSVLYGNNAYTGVINILTKQQGHHDNGEVTARIGSDKTSGFNLSAFAGDDGWKTSAYLQYQDSEGWDFSARDEGVIANPNMANVELDYGQRSSGAFFNASKGGFTSQLYLGKSRQVNLGPIPLNNRVVPNENYSMELAMLDLGYQTSLSENWQTQLNFTANTLRGGVDNLDGGIFSPESRSYEADVNITYQPSSVWRWLTGATTNYQEGKGELTQVSGGVPYSDEWISRLYTELRYSPSMSHQVFVGGQLNKSDGFKEESALRLAYIYRLDNHWGLKALYGEAYRSADQTERFFAVPGILLGNPDLEPGTVKAVDLQVFRQGVNSQFALTLYRSKQYDGVGRHTPAGASEPTYLNLPSRVFKGVETEGSYHYGQLEFTYGLTYQKTLQADLTDITLMPRVLGKLGVYWRINTDFSLGLFDNYAGQWGKLSDLKPAVQTLNPEAEDAHWVTLQARWMYKPNLDLEFYVTNVLDEDVYYPELVQRGNAVNTLPGRGGIGALGSISYRF